MNYKYLLKEIKRANRKTIKLFKYLNELKTNNFDYNLQININRVCDIDEILSNLEIDLEKVVDKNE